MEVNGWDVPTETTNVPMVTLTGLREQTNYMARVCGMCEWDTEYGAWSGWPDVYTGAHHDGPPQSIGNPDRFTQTMPNPARGKGDGAVGLQAEPRGGVRPEGQRGAGAGGGYTPRSSTTPLKRGQGRLARQRSEDTPPPASEEHSLDVCSPSQED